MQQYEDIFQNVLPCSRENRKCYVRTVCMLSLGTFVLNETGCDTVPVQPSEKSYGEFECCAMYFLKSIIVIMKAPEVTKVFSICSRSTCCPRFIPQGPTVVVLHKKIQRSTPRTRIRPPEGKIGLTGASMRCCMCQSHKRGRVGDHPLRRFTLLLLRFHLLQQYPHRPYHLHQYPLHPHPLHHKSPHWTSP